LVRELTCLDRDTFRSPGAVPLPLAGRKIAMMPDEAV
jgi:hypothetical protein